MSDWTAAQKADLQNYRQGQLLGFHRAVKSIAKYETAEVVRLASNGLVVRSEDGAECMVSAKQTGSFDVLEARLIEVSAGDRLLLTANRREAGLRITNGELVSVSAVDGAGRIQLEYGRTLPSNYRSFAHGYAVTAHRSQGKTVDSVILSGDGMQKELFYVAASRSLRAIRSGSRRPWRGRWRERRPQSFCAANEVFHIEDLIEGWRWRERWYEELPSWSSLFRNKSSSKKSSDLAPRKGVRS